MTPSAGFFTPGPPALNHLIPSSLFTDTLLLFPSVFNCSRFHSDVHRASESSVHLNSNRVGEGPLGLVGAGGGGGYNNINTVVITPLKQHRRPIRGRRLCSLRTLSGCTAPSARCLINTRLIQTPPSGPSPSCETQFAVIKS